MTTTLQQIESLEEARKILEAAAGKCASESNAVYAYPRHAMEYVDKQIATLLRDDGSGPLREGDGNGKS